MKRIARIFFGLAGLGLLAATIMPFTEQHAVASQPMLVTVTNTPLPVQGTVSVGNTPSVNVANSPSVNVANTPTVNISNASIGVSNPLDSSSKPVPLLVTSQVTPYQSECQIPSTTSSIGSCAFSPLNADTQLVIQEFAVGATTQVSLPQFSDLHSGYRFDWCDVPGGTSADHGLCRLVRVEHYSNVRGDWNLERLDSELCDFWLSRACPVAPGIRD